MRREEARALEGFDDVDMNNANHDVYDGANSAADVDTTTGRTSEQGEFRRSSEEQSDSTNTTGMRQFTRTDLDQHARPLEQHAQAIDQHPQSVEHHPQPVEQHPQTMEQHSQPLVNIAQQGTLHSNQQNTAASGHQAIQHHDEEARAAAPSYLPNPFGRQSEGDDSHHAMDLLRLLSRDATHAGGSPGTGGGPGARNNGAFRSVYSPHGPDAAPADGSNAAPSDGNTAVGASVGIAGRDRP